MIYENFEIIFWFVFFSMIISGFAIYFIMRFKYPSDLKKLLSRAPEGYRNMYAGLVFIVIFNRKRPSDLLMSFFVWLYRLGILGMIILIISLIYHSFFRIFCLIKIP